MYDCGQAWFKDAKYGLFIHFGLFSLLGGRYRGRTTPGLSEWIMNHFDIPLEEYRGLAERFDPVHFDAEAVCAAAVRWGMRYLCFTAKHHDGFALYASAASDYNSVKASPCRRDFVAELAAACERHALKFCLYYSQAQDWEHPGGYVAFRDNSRRDFRRYLDEKCLPQVRELLTQYGPVAMLWFDTPMGMSAAESRELRALVKALQPDCLISGRIGNGLGDFATTQDNRIPALPAAGDWEMPATLNHSWGYKEGDESWRSPDEVLAKLLKVVSRGGNYLLNIGPDGTGRVPEGSRRVLDAVGDWLRVNGASVFGSRSLPPYVYEAEGMLMTHRPHHLYLHFFPEACRAAEALEEIPLPNLANQVVAARWLADGTEAQLRQTRTLEGDPYWGLKLPPRAARPETPVLTLDVRCAEPDFRMAPLEL